MRYLDDENAISETVCAVVVTHNRKDLLRECLLAIQAQSRPTDEILVVNNACTDGTSSFLAEQFPGIRVLEMKRNEGGAGGFYAGVKWAYELGFDWIWLMDDDTVVAQNALHQLLSTFENLRRELKPSILASKVVWVDGSLHPRNIPRFKVFNSNSVLWAVEHGVLPIRSTSFVSIIVHREAIERKGFPLKEYFIWNDDVEYTARVLRDGFGVIVPSSIAYHKTARKNMTSVDAGPRFYYSVRNRIWMITRSAAWSGMERTRIGIFVFLSVWYYLWRSRFSWVSVKTVLRGIMHGLFCPRGIMSRDKPTK